MTITPVALFTYNRPEHTTRVLESLANCARLKECRLHIYCDGPKSEEHAAAVEAVRQIVREWAPKRGAVVIERTENLGLARSIVEGVNSLCQQFGRVIVVEDDLILSPAFLDYMLQCLDQYANQSKVYQISGYMFPVVQPLEPDAFFLPLTTSWGWATWSRAWQIFDWEAKDAHHLLRNPNVRRRFDLDNSYPYAEMLESRLKGENDSWAILFWWAVFKADGLVLYPRESYVSNSGFDNTGTHCGDNSWANVPTASSMSGGEIVRPLVLPDEIVADEAAFGRVVRFLRSEKSEGNLLARLGRRMVQRLHAK